MIKYLHGSALFLGIVAALYSTTNVYKDEEYQAMVKTFNTGKEQRHKAKKAKRDAAKGKK